MKKYIVRYGALSRLGVVNCAEANASGLGHGVKIVASTPRGSELATVLCEATNEQLKKLANTTEHTSFVRRLTAQDHERLQEIKTSERDDYARCLRVIRRMNVDLALMRVERLFGNERVVVYYIAEGRVDFRELVRALAAEFQTRIEMRQIGVRDKTKLLEYVGDCGREPCCRAFLSSMPPVAMRMARLQKATLDPSKISGRCERLKCCLRFEYETYNELQERSAPIESIVMTPEGKGKVVAQELLAHKVVVALESGAYCTFDNSVVEVVCACQEQPSRSETTERHGGATRRRQVDKKSSRHGKLGKDGKKKS